MKVTMTIAELTAVVVGLYNLPGNTVLEIAGLQRSSEAENIRLLHRAGDCLDGNDNIRTDKKITAIKLLREYVAQCGIEANGGDGKIPTQSYCSLLQAKTAVEDYKRFLAYVARYGIPKMGPDDPVAW